MINSFLFISSTNYIYFYTISLLCIHSSYINFVLIEDLTKNWFPNSSNNCDWNSDCTYRLR